MAEATQERYTETITVEKVRVNLTLTHEEALVLRQCMARVAGDPLTSDRRHTDAIGLALSRAGVSWEAQDASVVTGCIKYHAQDSED